MPSSLLLRIAYIFNCLGSCALCVMLVPFFVGSKGWLWWPVAVVLLPLTLPFMIIYYPSQIVSVSLAFAYHRLEGVRASVAANEINLRGRSGKQTVAWHDIQIIRRVYERLFPAMEARFADREAYQVVLKSGEHLYIDFVKESALRSRAEEHAVPTEGFSGRLSARLYEQAVPQ